MEMITFFIYGIGCLISVLYSLVGPFLVLLKNSFTIDAIGHSIIFGIAIGFLITHKLNSISMLFFALISAFIMNIINEYIQEYSSIEVDASLGISFSTLFTIGVLIISLYEKNIHLDIDMILLGNIEYSIYESVSILGIYIPIVFLILLFFIVLFAFFLYLQYDQLAIFLFDCNFAIIKGIPYKTISYIFIAIMTVLIVITFNTMGALLLLGMAVAPFGFSWQGSTSLKNFLLEGVFYSLMCTILGITVSLYFDFSIAATMVFCVTGVSLISLLNVI